MCLLDKDSASKFELFQNFFETLKKLENRSELLVRKKIIGSLAMPWTYFWCVG